MVRRARPFHYRPEDIAEGLSVLGQVRGQQIDAGTHPGMVATMAQQQAYEEHHCVTCGDKRQFPVEGEEEMPNGALRRYGTCETCGNPISKFVKGAKSKKQRESANAS